MKQEKDQVSDAELDAELEEMEKMNSGFNDLDEDQDEEEQQAPEEEEENDDDSPNGDDDEEEDDGDDDDPDEEEESEGDEPEDEDGEEEDEDRKPDTKRVSRNRPEKYIPVGKYKSEKQQHKDEIAQKDAEIASLREQLGGMTKEETDAVIKEWAEENGVDESQAAGLVDLIKKSTGIEDIQKTLDEMNGKKQEDVETEKFNNEWDEVLPDIKKQFPNASKAAIGRAQKRMDELAHSRRYASHPLEDIFKLNSDEFGGILNSKAPKKGPVGSRRPGASKKDATSMSFEKDSKSGKYDFSALHSMPDGPEKDKVIDNLSPEAYSDYIDDIDDDPMEVSRGGRKVKLDD